MPHRRGGTGVGRRAPCGCQRGDQLRAAAETRWLRQTGGGPDRRAAAGAAAAVAACGCEPGPRCSGQPPPLRVRAPQPALPLAVCLRRLRAGSLADAAPVVRRRVVNMVATHEVAALRSLEAALPMQFEELPVDLAELCRAAGDRG